MNKNLKSVLKTILRKNKIKSTITKHMTPLQTKSLFIGAFVLLLLRAGRKQDSAWA